MAVTVVLENGNTHHFPNAAGARPRGQGVIVLSADGKVIAAFNGPVASVTINGETIHWPPS
jgi:hypothetical protein